MTQIKKLGRPKGQTQDTKQDILEAGFRLFAAQGFSGTSISHIAKAAGVNQSLIYHHFANKLDLWQAVKAYIVQRHQPRYLTPSKAVTLAELIGEYVDSRFEFYQQNPEVLRMLLWQRLDSDQQELTTAPDVSKTPLYQALDSFQHQGDLHADIDLNFLILMMASMAIAPLMDQPGLFKGSPEKIKSYKDLVVATILTGIAEARLK